MSEDTIEELQRRHRLGMTVLATAFSMFISIGVLVVGSAAGVLDVGQVVWPVAVLAVVMVAIMAPGVWLAGTAGERLQKHPSSGPEYSSFSLPVAYRGYFMFVIHLGVAGLVLAVAVAAVLAAGVAPSFPRGLVVLHAVVDVGLVAGGLVALRLGRDLT